MRNKVETTGVKITKKMDASSNSVEQGMCKRPSASTGDDRGVNDVRCNEPGSICSRRGRPHVAQYPVAVPTRPTEQTTAPPPKHAWRFPRRRDWLRVAVGWNLGLKVRPAYDAGRRPQSCGF